MDSAKLHKELDEYAKNLSRMKGHPIRKATARAINRTLISARHEAAKEVQKKDGIKMHFIKNKAKVKKSYWQRLEGSLNIYQVPVPLISLVRFSRGGNRGINYKRVVGQRKKATKKLSRLGGTRVNISGGKRFYRNAFVNKVRKSGQIHILQRHGDTKYEVRVPKVNIHTTFNKVTPQKMTEAETKVYLKTLRHEYEARWNKIVK